MKTNPSRTQMLLLGIVANQELSGRGVAKAFKEQTGNGISYGTLYTTLRRMKEAGWVKTRDDQDDDGRVRYFRIDVDGRKALANGRQAYAELANVGRFSPKLA